jgi:hypothetical protein
MGDPCRFCRHRAQLQSSIARKRCWKPAKEVTMRAFIIACSVAVILAIGAAAMLNVFVQQSSSTAFSTTAVRLDEPDRPHLPTP